MDKTCDGSGEKENLMREDSFSIKVLFLSNAFNENPVIFPFQLSLSGF